MRVTTGHYTRRLLAINPVRQSTAIPVRRRPGPAPRRTQDHIRARVRTRARVAGRGAVQIAVVISGCLASVSRLRQVDQPWNPLAFPPGVAGLALRGALQFGHGRVHEAVGLDTGYAVEQPADLGPVNEVPQGCLVLGGDLAAVLLAFL